MAGPTHSIQLYPLFGLCIINNFLELESFAKIFYFVYPFPLAPPPSQFPNTTQPANPPPHKPWCTLLCDLFFSMIYAYSALAPPTLAHQPICLLKMLRLIDDSPLHHSALLRSALFRFLISLASRKLGTQSTKCCAFLRYPLVILILMRNLLRLPFVCPHMGEYACVLCVCVPCVCVVF